MVARAPAVVPQPDRRPAADDGDASPRVARPVWRRRVQLPPVNHASHGPAAVPRHGFAQPNSTWPSV